MKSRQMSKIFIGAIVVVCGWTLVAAAPQSNPKQQTNLFGCSGGNSNDSVGAHCCSATLGSLLFSGKRKYVLSNNHVIGAMGHAHPGDPISQPGLIDTQCAPARVVARFTVAAAMSDNVDAAIAELVDNTMDPTGTIIGIGLPSGSGVDPVRQVPVEKSGRTTGVTHSTILTYPTNVYADYSGLCRYATSQRTPFKNQIVITSDTDKPFALNGDSGALLMTEAKQPVGLLFSGSSTFVAAHPIKEVLERLSEALGAPLSFQPDSTLLGRRVPTPVEASDFTARKPRLLNVKDQVAEHSAQTTREPRATDQASSHLTAMQRALTASDKVFDYFFREPSVVGVGVGGPEEEPQMVVFVQKDLPPQLLERAGFTSSGSEYQGVKTIIVKTGPFRAFARNEQFEEQKACGN
jgi:hypothetical protein